MADLLWSVGAFADRHPDEARRIGEAHAIEAAALGLLFANAGVVRSGAIRDACFPSYPDVAYSPGARPPLTCCEGSCQPGTDSCCARGTCNCDIGEDAFEAIYPAAAQVVDEGHALQAALRDILADPDLEDVQAAIAQAGKLARAGKLAAYYQPAPPAKKLPNGSDGPARCPICGAIACPECGCTCECADGSAELAAEAGEAGPPE